MLFIVFFLKNHQDKRINQNDILSYYLADIDADDVEELLVIQAKGVHGQIETGERYGSHLEIYQDYEIKDGSVELSAVPMYRFDLTQIKPLFVQAGDINGDGIVEIAVCVYKEVKFHNVLAKRPFFYDIEKGELIPIWLGSRLSMPFLDYILADLDEDGVDELISIEVLKDGRKQILMYDWKGFGFEVNASSDEFVKDYVFVKKRSQAKLMHGGKMYDIVLDKKTHRLYIKPDTIFLE